ncbi:MAG: hypothetical protein N4A72_09465 [Bacteroidales bacterium]|jgi:antitoxin component YwqK of YwqJK toxin-antitoxin module|nr:hypothetical protein [Bacteroidales bacterium]
MKRLLLLTILITTSILTYSQEVSYILIEKDTCNNKYEHTNFDIWIYKDTIELQNQRFNLQYNFENSSFSLKDTGLYYISEGYYYGIPNRNPFHKVRITNYGLTIDTVIRDNLIEVNHLRSNPPWAEYMCCNIRCNGDNSVYYENNNLKMQGSFINGQPVNDLTKYYYNGTLRERNTYKKNYRIFRDYSPNGNIRYFTKEVHINKSPYWIRKEKKYYNISGSLIKETTYKKQRIRTETLYDSDGNKIYTINGNSRIKYYKNGQVKSILRWHMKFLDVENIQNMFFFFQKKNRILESYTHIAKLKKFDQNGDITVDAKLEANTDSRYYDPSLYYESYWIRYYKEYKSGKIIREVYDDAYSNLKNY